MANYQVNLGVSANVSQAQQSIQNLQNTLNSIANTKITVDGGSIDTAAQSARLLSEHLAKATNATTGKIDFTALSNSLKAANTDLATLSNNLLAMGPKGQQAFSQVANAVAHAELSTRKANKALQNFGVTLMNTIKWQAASSMIHGVMGAFNSAVSHIEKLDKSLNSIQIVTGKTAGEMAIFAKQAQEASRALSSTTQEYADAALIYFQQGLGEKAIAERTEATLKMAKVTGDAVATVSDQLTAIWNNFDDGSKSLEHYVDVITALGAATASSTDEIADGLQKFAAIAETVGLSYEYAATALATVTSETRQSADVVGTAFKTLFARIQGLNLGETLDDGTTLNKYSQALAKVGIDVKLANGQLKDMNTILDEMGEKWNRLNDDQQVALAQTVGGVRQYNQLIALMDNWDTFQINLEIAENSKGELDKQFAIYQTSIEASAAELKNATQTLYENLLSPEMITGFNEALTKTVNLVNTLVESAGGIGKLFEFGGLLLLQMVLPKLSGFMTNLATQFKDFIGYTKAAKLHELNIMSNTSHAIAKTTSVEGSMGPAATPKDQRKMNRATSLAMKADKAHEKLDNDKGSGFMHAVHQGQANVADAKLENAVAKPGFMPNTEGIGGVGADVSAQQMRTQIMQEEAGYTAAILDTKKQILALDEGLTDQQRQSYKAYSDQVAQEQEALRLAREKQVVAKETADQSKRNASVHVGASKEGQEKKQQQNDAIRQTKKAELDAEYQDRLSKMDKHDKHYGSDKDALDKEFQAKKDEVDKTSYINNKQIDFSGEETKSMVGGFQDSELSTAGQAITQEMTTGLAQSADGGPAASIENLEKLGQLQAQYNADAGKANGIYTELSGNIGEAGKRTEQQQKTLKKTADTMKSLGADAKKGLVKSMEESAEAMELSSEEAEGLQKVMDSLESDADIDLGDLNPKQMKVVQNAVGDLAGGLGEAGESAGALADAMSQDMASATGEDVKMFQNIATDAQNAKASALDADGAAKQLQGTLSTGMPVVPDPFGSVVLGAQQALQSLTGLAMGAQMLTTGFNTLLNPDTSGVEKLMGVMMALQGVMSIVQGVQAAMNVVDTIAIAIKAAKAAATAKETGEETKGLIPLLTNTAATIANAVAKLFAAEASKGLAGVIAGVLGAALIIGTMALVANTVATEQNTRKAEEDAAAKEAQADSAKAAAEAAREELNAVMELTDAYMDALKVYEETGQGKEDLRKAAFEAIDAMNLEGHELEILAGNYANLTERIKEYNAAKAGKAVSTSNTSMSASGAAFLAKENVEGTGGLYTTTSGKKSYLTLHLGSSGGDETALARWLAANTDSPWKIDGNLVKAEYGSSNDIPYLMKEFYRMYDGVSAIATTSEQNEMEFFSESQEMRDSGSWEMGQDLVAAYDTHVDTSVTGAQAMYLSDVDSQAEYNEAYEKMKTYALEARGLLDAQGKVIKGREAEAEAIIKALDTSLRENEEWADYELRRRGLESIEQDYSDSAAAKYLQSDGIKKWAEDHGVSEDEAIDLFLRINPQYYGSTDEIDEALNRMQSYLDANKIIVKYDLITGAKEALKEQMSGSDWANFYNQYADLFDPNSESYIGMTFKDFTNMSPSERQKALDMQQGSKSEALDTMIADESGTLADMQTDTYKQNYIDTKSEQMATEYEDAAREKRVEVAQEYTSDQISSFTDTGSSDYGTYLGEASRWYNGTMTADEKAAIDKWATGEGWANADEYLNAKWEYLNAYNGVDGNSFGSEYGLGNLGIVEKTEEQRRAEAETQYEKEVAGQETKVAALEDEKHISDLVERDAEIEKYDLDAEEVYNYTDALIKSGQFLEENREQAMEFATAQLRMEKGFEDLVEGFEDWDAVLGDSEASLKDISKVMPGVNKMLGNMLDLSDEEFALLPDDFAQQNWKLIQDVYNQVDGAYEALRAKVTEEIIMRIGLSEESKNAVTTEVNNFLANVELDDIEVGTTLDQTGFAEGLQSLLDSGAVTVEQMNSILEGIGYEPDIQYERVEVASTAESAQTGYVQVTDVNGNVRDVPIDSVMTVDGKQYVDIPKIGGSKFKGGGSGIADAKKNNGGGGGGSKPKKADKVKKSDVVERYKEINDELKETQHLMTKTNAEAEGLWGEARFKKMREGVELLKRENQQLKERMKWSKNYVDEDRKALDAAASEAGITFEYDPEDGYITNYTEQMSWLYEQLDNAINAANADGNATEEEQEEIDKWQKYIDDIESVRGDYEEALDQWRSDEEKWLENRNQIWQDNFDILSEELELKVQLNTQDLEVLQYFLDKIEDAVYGIAEAFASGKYFEQQFANYSANLGLLSNDETDEDKMGFYQQLQQQYRDGEIGLSQYKQGLADIMGMTIENLENLQDLKESMQEFYGDVLEKALEEIAIYTDSMENLNSVLDHYSNILELVGKQDDYASKNKVLSSKAKNLRNEIDVQKKLYKESADDAAYWAQKMNEAEVGSNEYETYKKNWQAAEAAAQESQDAILAKTQEWAEAMKSIIENELAGFADTLEKSLTGGISFDELMTSMERRSSLQEEYLTTTNKIYETNKLMRTAQQEIDKTSNTAAKRRMAQFISETQQLQNKNKLSQYELDIQQAKYDLLLAEIALEEAQDAKSVVRLQRDAEGNFGYVYTADQNAVADAEQQLADAQNSLYNIGLEGANNYQQKYAETLQESQEAITELTQMWMNGEISSEEEFNRRKQEIVEYYGEKLQQYSDLHSIALTTDSRVVKDAWSSDFTSMTASVDVWKQNVGTYFSQAGESMKDWADICAQTLEDSGLDDMDKTLGDIDQKSKDLKNTLIGEDGKSGVVAAMMAEVDAAGKLSEEYISIQDAIDGVIAEYEELLKILNEDYQSPNGPGDEEGKQNGNENDGEEENNNNNQNNDNNETPPPAAELSVGSTVKVKTSASKWASGEGIWGPVKGNNFKVMQISGEKVLIGDPCGPNYTASGVTGWIKKTDLEGFDTGGYTGDWSGAYGKLALLHKKELILKEGDTANFLAGMDLLNKIISVIDLQSVNNSLGGLLSSPSLGHVGDEGGILEQQVHIEASFPGVSDHSEIEEAFNNLVNQAAQYANRK